MAGFMDFLTGGSANSLSLPEILGTVLEGAGQAEAARGGWLYGPLGGAVAGFGALGPALAQRQRDTHQAAQLAEWAKGVPEFAPYAPMLASGSASIKDVAELVNARKQKQANPWAIYNPKTGEERAYEPVAGQTLPPGFVTPSFKPQKPSNEEKQITGTGRTIAQSLGYDPDHLTAEQAGAVLKKEQEYALATRPTTNINLPVSPADLLTGPGGKPGVVTRGKGGALGFEAAPEGVTVPPKGNRSKPTIHNEMFQGYKYGFKYSEGDPSYGVGRFNDKEPSRINPLGRGKPAKGIVWKIGGRIIAPEKLSPTERARYAAELKERGFTIDEITGLNG